MGFALEQKAISAGKGEKIIRKGKER